MQRILIVLSSNTMYAGRSKTEKRWRNQHGNPRVFVGHKTIACVYGILMGGGEIMIYLRTQKSQKGVAVKKH